MARSNPASKALIPVTGVVLAAHAVVLLGFDNLRILVIASGITGATAGIAGFDMKGFWQRSFAMANTAKRLSRLVSQQAFLFKGVSFLQK